MIESKRIILRPLEPLDNTQIFKYRSDTETNKYQSWIPEKLKDVDEFISKLPMEFNKAETWSQLAIIEKRSNIVIGDIGIHFIGEDNLQSEIGITLSKNKQGKGFATEAMKATIDFLFKELNKHRIITSIDPENTRSIKLVERLGFRKEAHFKESLFINGEWVDDIIYAILYNEWS
ncbi:GNAT family N-acetyltransferase [Lutibacter citreus]|uniref:GNAT family N-acetyltransferase n=1 Tax=Lutibacter citreus TaxID=2138210 RepID=UPI001FE2AC05|nr:GNAT family protein [Lutibacter citreus]